MASPEVIFTICRRTTALPYHIFKSLITVIMILMKPWLIIAVIRALSSYEIKPEKNSDLNGIRTHDPCDTGHIFICSDTCIDDNMEFLFECSTWYLTSLRSERVRYHVKHEMRNSISQEARYYSVYYIYILMTTFPTISRRFPNTFRRFPKILQKLPEGQTIVSDKTNWKADRTAINLSFLAFQSAFQLVL